MSVSRHCSIVHVESNNTYYLELADEEYAGYEDANLYGPFKSEAEAEEYLYRFSNPGGIDFYSVDEAPKTAPNGSKIISPSNSNFWR